MKTDWVSFSFYSVGLFMLCIWWNPFYWYCTPNSRQLHRPTSLQWFTRNRFISTFNSLTLKVFLAINRSLSNKYEYVCSLISGLYALIAPFGALSMVMVKICIKRLLKYLFMRHHLWLSICEWKCKAQLCLNQAVKRWFGSEKSISRNISRSSLFY